VRAHLDGHDPVQRRATQGCEEVLVRNRIRIKQKNPTKYVQVFLY
jgi:hypothetical protein